MRNVHEGCRARRSIGAWWIAGTVGQLCVLAVQFATFEFFRRCILPWTRPQVYWDTSPPPPAYHWIWPIACAVLVAQAILAVVLVVHADRMRASACSRGVRICVTITLAVLGYLVFWGTGALMNIGEE